MKLYELTADFAALAAMEEDDIDVSAALNALTVALEDKCAGVVRVLATIDAEAEALKAEEKRLADKRKTRENRAKALRDYVKAAMTAGDIRKIETPLATFSLKDGPPRVVVNDEMLVPEAYTRTVVEIDKAAILDAFKRDGECVPGTSIERSKALTIK
jgi:hypothetical protein